MALPLWFGGPPDTAGSSGGNSPGDAERRRSRARESIEAEDKRTDDASMVARIRGGDAAAFESLFRSYHTRLVPFAASYVGSIDAGEEVVADVFAWVWEHRTTWTPTSGLSAYMFGAVRNRALNVVKQQARDNRRATAFREVGEVPGSAAQPIDAEQRVERDNFTATALRMIAELPERRRLILSLRWKQGLGWDEIAAVIGATSSAVQMEHSRILAALRARLRAL